MDNSILEQISLITELNDLHHYMQDKDVDYVLKKTIQLIAKPDVSNNLSPLIVQLQALAMKFNLQFAHLAYIVKPTGNSDDVKRKNIYKVLSAELDKLVMALKYVNRG